MRIRRLAAVPLAFVLLAASCASRSSTSSIGGGSNDAPTQTSVAPSESESSSPPSSAATPSASASPLIEPGKNFAFVKSVDTSADPATVTYDLAYFLTGDEAEQAAKDHGDEVPPPNDYYIVNDNPKLRTVPLADGAQLVLLDWKNCCDGTVEGSLEDFAKAINSGKEITVGGTIYKGGMSPYWLIAKGGSVVRIEEQYLP